MTMDFDSRAKTWDSDPAKTRRAETVAEGIRHLVPLSRDMPAFEYGCGTGLLGFALAPYVGEITLADNSIGMLEVLTEKIKAGAISNMTPMKLDLAIDPLPAARFSLVCTLLTLHHFLDTPKILKDFFTLLNSPGYLCVADLDKEDGSFHGDGFTGHNGFNRDALAAAAHQAGFSNVRFKEAFKIIKNQREYSVFLMAAKKA